MSLPTAIHHAVHLIAALILVALLILIGLSFHTVYAPLPRHSPVEAPITVPQAPRTNMREQSQAPPVPGACRTDILHLPAATWTEIPDGGRESAVLSTWHCLAAHGGFDHPHPGYAYATATGFHDDAARHTMRFLDDRIAGDGLDQTILNLARDLPSPPANPAAMTLQQLLTLATMEMARQNA